MSTRPPFPRAVDSTMLAAFRSCGRKFQLEYLHHWKQTEPNVNLHAGQAFARGLEMARRTFFEGGRPPDEALGAGLRALAEAYGSFECPVDSPKSLSRMLGALEFYFDTWPLGRDPSQPAVIGGRPAIEFSFAEPLPILHPETAEPIIYTGRSDLISDFAGGRWIQDEKTTKQLGASWGKQWDLRSQFTGYVWGGQQVGVQTAGVLVRGISILKTQYGQAEHITYRPQWMIDRWLAQVVRDLTRAIEAWQFGVYDFNLDHACSEYGGCPFRGVCLLQDPSDWLTTYYTQRVWNPLTREEKPLGTDKLPHTAAS